MLRQTYTLLALLFGLLSSTVTNAQWGGYGYPYNLWYEKRININQVPPELLAPADGYEISDNNGQNVTVNFSWLGHSSVSYPGSLNDFLDRSRPSGLRRSPPRSVSYTLCLYENTRCGQPGSGMQMEFPVGNQTRLSLVLSSASLQGKTFHWGVEECITVGLGSLRYLETSCRLSPAFTLSWEAAPPPRLSPPCALSTAINPNYGWNLEFSWCDVADADHYIICMSDNQAALASCQADANTQAGIYKDTDSNNSYIRLGNPPMNAGTAGGTFHWKVSACRQLGSVPPDQLCSDWSAVATDAWPPP
jgi:hypothetical protein